MKKRPVIKRREKRVVKQILFMVLGTVVFIALFGFGVYKFMHNYVIISPVPSANESFKAIQGVKQSNKKVLLEQLLKKNNVPYISVAEADTTALLVTQEKNQQMIFSQNKPLDEQISSLQLILSRLTIEGKQYSSLDFRFDKPVITFK